MLVLRPTELRISLMMVSRSLENKKANLARSQRQPQISFAVYTASNPLLGSNEPTHFKCDKRKDQVKRSGRVKRW